VTLPFKEDCKVAPQKASTVVLSPSKRAFCHVEIADLLAKGLIEPSKSALACRAFVVNKHSKIKIKSLEENSRLVFFKGIHFCYFNKNKVW